jgi:hypothetical protein
MPTLLKPSFPHRHNADGSYDSICLGCFATVASVTEECDLEFYESEHKCDPVAVYQSLAPMPKERCRQYT